VNGASGAVPPGPAPGAVPSGPAGPGGHQPGPVDGAAGARGSSRLLQRFLQLVGVVPLGCAAVYLVVVIADFPRIIADVHLNPDASWAPVLVRDLAANHGGGHILVGAASQYVAIWFLVLTRWAPFRAGLWNVAPFLTYLLGLGFVAWAVRRIAGWWPALMTFALGAGANFVLLLTVMSEGIHGETYFADCVMAAFGVYWATRSPGSVWRCRVVAVGVILLAGATLSSDTLFLATGLGPFLGAAIALWLVTRDRRRGRMAALAMCMTAASAIVAVGLDAWMNALGFRRTYETGGYALVSSHVAQSNVAKFARQLRDLANGSTAAHASPVVDTSHTVMAVLLVAAIVLPFLLLAQTLRTRAEWSSGTGTDEARFLFVAFWVLSGVAICAAFSLTAFADGPSDPSRYVAPAFFALAATAPVWAERFGWRRLVMAAAVTLFCVLSITERQGLFEYGTAFHQTAAQGPKVIAFLESQGINTGYTGYFDSHPLTLQSDLRVHFYPVGNCRAPASPNLCPFYVNVRTDWYVPRPGVRTFVLFDAMTPADVAALPGADLGKPVAARQFGALYVFVYDYDVASRFDPPCPAAAANPLSCPSKAA
jgi:hypothetical protein